jgi:hypothetical protein
MRDQRRGRSRISLRSIRATLAECGWAASQVLNAQIPRTSAVIFRSRMSNSDAFASRPALAGRGDRALARWAGRLTQSFVVVAIRLPPHRFHRWRVESRAPSTILRAPRYGWSPSPAFAGADKQSRSRDAVSIRVMFASNKTTNVSLAAPIFVRAYRRWHRHPHDQGFKPRIRKKQKESGTPKDADPYPPQPVRLRLDPLPTLPRLREREGWGPLAHRRSTTALA